MSRSANTDRAILSTLDMSASLGFRNEPSTDSIKLKTGDVQAINKV